MATSTFLSRTLLDFQSWTEPLKESELDLDLGPCLGTEISTPLARLKMECPRQTGGKTERFGVGFWWEIRCRDDGPWLGIRDLRLRVIVA